MSTDRDTHFLGFATLLIAEIEHQPNVDGHFTVKDLQTLIAQRAYDLVRHALEHINSYDLDVIPLHDKESLITLVPDLTAWPE